MQKSLQTNCLLPSQRSMQTDTLENQRILHVGSPAIRRHGHGPRNQASLRSDGRGVQSPRSSRARRGQLPRTLDQESPQDHFTAVRFMCGRPGIQYVISRSSPRRRVHHMRQAYGSFIT